MGPLPDSVHSCFRELGIDGPGGCKEGLIHMPGMRGRDGSASLNLHGSKPGGRYKERLLTGGEGGE